MVKEVEREEVEKDGVEDFIQALREKASEMGVDPERLKDIEAGIQDIQEAHRYCHEHKAEAAVLFASCSNATRILMAKDPVFAILSESTVIDMQLSCISLGYYLGKTGKPLSSARTMEKMKERLDENKPASS